MKTLSITYPDVYKFSVASSLAVVAASYGLSTIFHPAFWLLLLAVPVILTIRKGIDLDFENHRYRKFSCFLWMKNGEWKAYNPANQLVLLSKTGYQPNGNLDQYEGVRKVFDLYMMDPEHRSRMYLYSAGSLKRVNGMAKKIESLSTLEIAVYNPPSRR